MSDIADIIKGNRREFCDRLTDTFSKGVTAAGLQGEGMVKEDVEKDIKVQEWEICSETGKKKKKKLKKGEVLVGGVADKKTINDIVKKHKTKTEYVLKQLAAGMKVEKEHTKDETKAAEITRDHLWEDIDYYKKLKKVEKK